MVNPCGHGSTSPRALTWWSWRIRILKKNNAVLSRRGVPFLGIPKDNSRWLFKSWLMLVKLTLIVRCNWILFMSYHCFPYSLLCPLKALYPIPVFHLYQFLCFTELSGSLPFLQRTLPLKICKCHFQSDNMEMSFPDWYCFPSHVLLEQGPSASLHSFPACDGILFCNASTRSNTLI